MVTNTRDRGVRVTGNEHRYPLVLWEWGGGGRGCYSAVADQAGVHTGSMGVGGGDVTQQWQIQAGAQQARAPLNVALYVCFSRLSRFVSECFKVRLR